MKSNSTRRKQSEQTKHHRKGKHQGNLLEQQLHWKVVKDTKVMQDV